MRRCSRCRNPVPIQSDVRADCRAFERGIGAVVLMFVGALVFIVIYVAGVLKFNPH